MFLALNIEKMSPKIKALYYTGSFWTTFLMNEFFSIWFLEI